MVKDEMRLILPIERLAALLALAVFSSWGVLIANGLSRSKGHRSLSALTRCIHIRFACSSALRFELITSSSTTLPRIWSQLRAHPRVSGPNATDTPVIAASPITYPPTRQADPPPPPG